MATLTRSERIVLLLLLAADAVLLLAVATRPLPILDNMTMLDDSYLSLGVARNIALGKGPLQGLAYTNGFQPLYVFLMVPVYAIWRTDLETPVRVALLFGAACNVATLYLLFRWLRRMTGSVAVAVLPCIAWIVDYSPLYESLNGLETSLSVLLVVASFSVFHQLMEAPDKGGWVPDRRLIWLLGVVLGLAFFARVDNAILIAAVGGAIVLRLMRHRRDQLVPALLPLVVAIVLINLPWWLYSWHYTGKLFPESGAAVRFRSLKESDSLTLDYWQQLLYRGGRDIVRVNRELLIAAGICVVWGWFGAKRRRLSVAPPLPRWLLGTMVVWALGMFGAYTGYVFAPWYFQRYFFPLIVLVLVLLAFAWRSALATLPAHGLVRSAAIVGAPLLLVGGFALRPQIQHVLTFNKTAVYGYMNVGLWARDHFPAGTRIGAVQSGALGYFAPDLTVVNLDGVVNGAALQALRDHQAIEYVRSVGVQALVNWTSDTSFLLAHSAPGDADFLEDQGAVPGFRSFNQVWHVYRVE